MIGNRHSPLGAGSRPAVEQIARTHKPLCSGLVLVAGWLVVASPMQTVCAQNAYLDHPLVSDVPGLADITDTNLLNPWAMAFSSTGPIWISDNHSGLSTIYSGSGTPSSLIVSIQAPGGTGQPGAPTGMIFNGGSGFSVSNAPARFIFSTEDGTIVAWNNNTGTNGVIQADNSAAGAIYKGLALATNGGSPYLYASDFHNGKIDVFDSSFRKASLAGSFSDPNLPSGYAPFSVENIGGELFVAYAVQDAVAVDDVAGLGNGIVNVFDGAGTFLRRFATSNTLNSPWGITKAPAGFGPLGGALLIGNFGDGAINAFDPASGNWLGYLTNAATGLPFALPGLWGLKFGNDGSGGDAHTLYYTAGIAGPAPGGVEDHGLFGSLTSQHPSFVSAAERGLAETLRWAGGVGPYLLQNKKSLADANWTDVLTTSDRTRLVARSGDMGLFRVVNQATNLVLPFTALLTGDSEIPAVATAATGIGTFSLAGSNLTYSISYANLSGNPTGSHIHGPASPTNTASIMIPFSGLPAATSGTIAGVVSLTADQVAALVNGQTYANIHSSAHGSGEIRGQVVPLRIPLTFSGAQESPAVLTPATGSGFLTLIGSQVYYDISYSGLLGAATASHIHGPADSTISGNVLVPLATPTGKSGSISGTVSLNPTQLAYLLAGLTYVNIHSATNTGGEIRAQIYPAQFSAKMSGAAEVATPAVVTSGTGTGLFTVLNSVLTYHINFTNLTANATASHIHGPATPSQNASVMVPFSNVPAATSGIISGSATLTSQQLLNLVSGLTYANIHTPTYVSGEIRGQIMPQN